MSELTKEQLLEYVKKQKLKIKKLEGEILSLKESPAAVPSIDTSVNSSAALHSEIESLEKQISAKDTEISLLNKAVEDAEDDKIKCISQKNAEISLLNEKLSQDADSQKVIQSLHIQINELTQMTKDQSEEIESFQGKVEKADSVRIDLEKTIDSLKTELADSTTKSTDLLAELQKTQENVKDLHNTREGSNSAMEALQKALDSVQVSQTELQNELETQRSSSHQIEETLRLELESKAMEATTLLEKFKSLENEFSKQSTEYDTLQSANAALTSNINEMKVEIDDKVLTISKLTQENLDIQSKLDEELNRVDCEDTASVPSASIGSSATSATTTPATAATTKKKGKSNNKKNKGKGCGSSTETAKNIPEEPSSESNAAMNSTTNNNTTTSAAVEEIENLNKKLQEFTLRETNLVQEISILQEQLQAYEAKEEKSKLDTEDLQKSLTDTQILLNNNDILLEKERIQSKKESVELQNRIDELLLQINTSNTTSTTEEELKLKENMLSDLQVQYENNIIINEKLKNECSTAADQISLLSANLEEKHEEIIKLKNECSTAEDKISLLSANLEEKHEEIIKLKNECSTAADQISLLSANLEEKHEEIIKLKNEKELIENQLNTANNTINSLQNEILTLKETNDLNTTTTNNTIQTEIDSLRNQISILKTTINTITDEKNILQNELNTNKDNNLQNEQLKTKLTIKLKQKIKENNEFSNEIASLRENLMKMNESVASKEKEQYNEQIQLFERDLVQLKNEKNDIEIKYNQLHENMNNLNEEKRILFNEKQKLEDDLMITLKKTENIQTESNNYKTERDKIRLQYLDIENKLNTSSKSNHDKIENLTNKNMELTTMNTQYLNQISTINETLALSNSEIITLKNNSTVLIQLKEKNKNLLTTIENLKQELSTLKTETDTKTDTANDRIKKLKQLLSKVNALSQEKELKLLQYQAINDRAKKFNILTRIGIKSSNEPSAELLEYCLIYEHRAATTTGTNSNATKATGSNKSLSSLDGEIPPSPSAVSNQLSQYRWIEQRMAHKWIAEGSTLLGGWPEPMQETYANNMHNLKAQLETERDELNNKLNDITSQFQAYKIRAQTALKRIGTEDRNEKLKLQQTENAEIERLHTIISEYKEKIEESQELIQLKTQDFSKQEQTIIELNNNINIFEKNKIDQEILVESKDNKIQLLKKELETVQEDCRQMKEQYESIDRKYKEKRLLQKQVEEDAEIAERVRMSTNNNNNSCNSNNTEMVAAKTAGQVEQNQNEATHEATAAIKRSNVNSEEGGGNNSSYTAADMHSSNSSSPRARPSAVTTTTTNNTAAAGALASPTSTPTAATADNKLLFFQQADSVLRESIVVLRRENAELMVEINEMKNDLGLREDQVIALKNTIRELELSLCREKEFNAENRRINADYLVNILRNLLMSTEPSERAKLVPVVCQILQFPPEETRIITEKWAVRSGGLVGWLLPPRPATTIATAASPRYTQHSSGMSIDRGDGAGRPAGDMSYDPTTGAGIDVTGY